MKLVIEMKRATQKEMIKRRGDMTSFHKKGMKTNDWIPIVASKYGVSEDAVKKDWNKRPFWNKNMIDLRNCGALIRGCIFDIENYSIKLENFVKTTKNENCKLGAIKQLTENRFKLIKFYHSYDNEDLRERIENLERVIGKGVVIP